MKRIDLIHKIALNEGMVISHGTLRIESLLVKIYYLLIQYGLSKNIQKNIEDLFSCPPLNINYNYGLCYMLHNKKDKAEELFNEDIFRYLNSIAPIGYYFGSHENDGSCFGFFKCIDKIEPKAIKYCELVSKFKCNNCGACKKE